MEQNYGGPVWHASAAPTRFALGEATLRERALAALLGVGDTLRGEWYEWSGRVYHVRRRLTEEEERLVGPVVDVRGTPEGARRHGRMRPFLSPEEFAMGQV